MAVAPNVPGARPGDPVTAKADAAQEDALQQAAVALEPSLEAARALADGHSLIPLGHTFVEVGALATPGWTICRTKRRRSESFSF